VLNAPSTRRRYHPVCIGYVTDTACSTQSRELTNLLKSEEVKSPGNLRSLNFLAPIILAQMCFSLAHRQWVKNSRSITM
jgi:hypothetical protein